MCPDVEERMRAFEEAVERSTKAVYNPKVRRTDPESWKCLSDEQRDIIHQWYVEDMNNQQEIQKQKEKESSDSNSWACVLGLSPFAFYHALERGGSFLEILFESVAALLVWGLIFFLTFSLYQAARKAQHPPFGKLYSFFFHVIALAVSFFVVYCFYLRVK